MNNNNPGVSVVIPNYNGLKFLEMCLESLKIQSYSVSEIIVVDNNSSDNSVNFIKHNYNYVKVIKLDKNFGFSKSVNEGIKLALTDENNSYIVLLNNDVECNKDFIKELVRGFESDIVGSVASKMLNYKTKNSFDNTGLFLNLKDTAYLRGYDELDHGQYDKREFVFGCCAGAGMYRREVFEKVGLFDEDFFAYNEDIDLDIRMQLNGYRCIYNPKSICYHIGSATSGNKSPFKIYLCEMNIVVLRVKNYPLRVIIRNLHYFLYYTAGRFYHYLFDDSVKCFFYGIAGLLAGMLKSPKYIMNRYKNNQFYTNSFYDIKFMP